MHIEARRFLAFVLLTFGEEYYIEGGKILDVGSLDINGNNRFYFGDCEYVGCDLTDGPNVTHVGDVQTLDFPKDYFDVVISTESLVKNTSIILSSMWKLLKPGGILVITAPSNKRGGDPGLVDALKAIGASIYVNDKHNDIYAIATKGKWRVKEFMYV